MAKNLISIIIGMYNGEKFLSKCINSILNQDYENFELLLIDDGSPDNCLKIAKNFEKKDKRIKVYHKENGGVSSARNYGLARAKGDYICIMDQDDWIEKNYLSYLLSLILKNNASVSVVPNVIISTEDKCMYNEKESPDTVKVWSGEDTAREMLYRKIEIGPWNKMISKKLIEENNIKFHEDLFGGEGYAFSIECFMASAKVAVGYHGIYHYRIDNYTSEMSSFKMRTAKSSFHAFEIMYEEFLGVSKKMDNALRFGRWNTYVSYLDLMVACKEQKNYPKEYKTWKKIMRKDALFALNAPIGKKRKIKIILRFISPKITRFISKYLKKGRKFN